MSVSSSIRARWMRPDGSAVRVTRWCCERPWLPAVNSSVRVPLHATGRSRSTLRIGRKAVTAGSLVRVPIYLRRPRGEPLPEAMALRVRFDPAAVAGATLERGRDLVGLETIFETAMADDGSVAYLVSFEEVTGGRVSDRRVALVVWLELELAAGLEPGTRIPFQLDGEVTLLSNREGSEVSTVGNGGLRLVDGWIEVRPSKRRLRR